MASSNAIGQTTRSLMQDNSDWEKGAGEAGNALKKAEQNFMDIAGKEDANPGDVEKAKMKYQAALRVFETISEAYKAFNETLRAIIQKLSGNS